MSVTRVKCYSINPEEDLDNTNSWGDLAVDLNSDEKAIICAYIPKNRGSDINIVQEQMFIGGLNLSAMWRTFRHDIAQDDSSNFTAEAITNNLSPTLDAGQPDTMRVMKIAFPRINPLELTGVIIDFVVDVLKPEESGPTWNSLDEVSGSHVAGTPSAVGRSFSLRIRDTGNSNNGIAIFDSVKVFFIRLFGRNEGDE